MKVIIKQNGETRVCEINLGMRVKHPKGYWGTISMFGWDDENKPRILMRIETGFGKTIAGGKKGVYPHELQLEQKHFEMGEII